MACFLRWIFRRAAVALCLLAVAGTCVFAQTSPSSLLLPQKFVGWTQEGAAKMGTAPGDLDAAIADVLTEYGLKDFAEDAYHRGNAKSEIRALHFVDATGAYGAFTFYRKPDMTPLKIGKGGAGNAHEVVFWTGTDVVDAVFPAGSSGADPALRALAQVLPPSVGASEVPPTLPSYLPAKSLDRMTIRYAIGPAAYVKGGGVLPPGLIAFSRDAEAVTARYSTSGGAGMLTLLEFPTPQMAIQAQSSISALLKQPPPALLKQSDSAALQVRRAGPLVAVTSGKFSAPEAQALLEQVRYQTNITWNQPHGKSELRKAADMLIGIAYLTVFLAVCALLLGFFLGGGRAIWRVLRGKPASSLYEEDFISLNLSDWQGRKLP